MKLIYHLVFLFFFFTSYSQQTFLELDVKTLTDYSIIGLGEETHGVKTINEYRNLVTFNVINQSKVKYIIWEESFANLYKVNKLLDTQHPNFDEILKEFTWFWQTEETRSLLHFIHQYNQKNKQNQILLLGMDLSSHLSIYNNIVGFFKDKISNPYILDEYRSFKEKFVSYKRLSKKENKQLIQLANLLQAELQNEEEKYLKWYTLTDIELMKLHMISLINSSSYFMKNKDSRDLTMFKMVESIYSLCQDDEKVIIYAHNGHLQKKDDYEFQKIVGTYLDEKYKDKYFALGFEFGKGSYLCSESSIGVGRTLFRAYVMKKSIREFMSSRTQEIGLNSNSEILSYLYQLDHPFSFINIHSIDKNSTEYKLLNSSQLYHNIGGGCTDEDKAYMSRIWTERFDGIFFIKNVEPTDATF